MVALVLGVAGPYVVGGLRLEQLLVYPMAIAYLMVLTARSRPRLPTVIVPLSVFAGWCLLSTSLERPTLLQFVTSADTVLLPIAAIMAAGLVVERVRDVQATMNLWFGGVVAVNAASGGLSIAQSIFGLADWSSHWWSSGAESVGLRALAGARWTGIYNQPVEAGIAYALSLAIAVTWLLSETRSRSQRLVLAAAASFCLAGGLLSQSKAFVASIAVCGVALALSGRLRGRLSKAFGWSLPLVGLLSLLPSGARRQSELWLQSLDERFVDIQTLTAGRVGGAAGDRIFAEVLKGDPLGGLGMASGLGPIDTLTTAALLWGGFVGLGLVVAIAVELLRISWDSIRSDMVVAPSRRPVAPAWAVTLPVLVGAIGGPSIYMNRLTSLLWVSIPLCLFAQRERPRRLNL